MDTALLETSLAPEVLQRQNHLRSVMDLSVDHRSRWKSDLAVRLEDRPRSVVDIQLDSAYSAGADVQPDDPLCHSLPPSSGQGTAGVPIVLPRSADPQGSPSTPDAFNDAPGTLPPLVGKFAVVYKEFES
jgi:hypothetical protein